MVTPKTNICSTNLPKNVRVKYFRKFTKFKELFVTFANKFTKLIGEMPSLEVKQAEFVTTFNKL